MAPPPISQSVLADFVGLLRTRFTRGTYTSEDSVRYTFFAALLRSGMAPHDVSVEHPHPVLSGREIDMVVMSDRSMAAALEFKYDRTTPSTHNQPRTRRAGAIFGDMVRLLRLQGDVKRILVYLTDPEMARYMRNPVNGLNEWFSTRAGNDFLLDSDFFSEMAATFTGEIGQWPGPARLLCHVSEDIPGNHYLKILEIIPDV